LINLPVEGNLTPFHLWRTMFGTSPMMLRVSNLPREKSLHELFLSISFQRY